MISRLHLSAIILIAAAIWAAFLIANGVSVSATWATPFSSVVGVLFVILAVFDYWLWKWPIFRGWLVNRPNMSGTWKVTIKSDWLDPTTGNPKPPIEAYLVVRQTFSSINMRLLTEESAGDLLTGEIARSADGSFKVGAIYRNEPKLSVRDRSPIHYGAFFLQVEGNPPSALTGHYWTDRNTKGAMVASNRRSKIFHSFDAAKLKGN